MPSRVISQGAAFEGQAILTAALGGNLPLASEGGFAPVAEMKLTIHN